MPLYAHAFQCTLDVGARLGVPDVRIVRQHARPQELGHVLERAWMASQVGSEVAPVARPLWGDLGDACVHHRLAPAHGGGGDGTVSAAGAATHLQPLDLVAPVAVRLPVGLPHGFQQPAAHVGVQRRRLDAEQRAGFLRAEQVADEWLTWGLGFSRGLHEVGRAREFLESTIESILIRCCLNSRLPSTRGDSETTAQ